MARNIRYDTEEGLVFYVEWDFGFSSFSIQSSYSVLLLRTNERSSFEIFKEVPTAAYGRLFHWCHGKSDRNCYDLVSTHHFVGFLEAISHVVLVALMFFSPLQVAQTVLRLRDNKHKGTIDCLRQLYADGGLSKLFTGMRAKLLQTVLTAAFTFLTYEQILSVVHATLISAVGMK